MSKIKLIKGKQGRRFNEQINKFNEETEPLFKRLITENKSYCEQAAETSAERFNKCLLHRTCCKYQDDYLQCRRTV